MRGSLLSTVFFATTALLAGVGDVGCASPEGDEAEDQGSAAAATSSRTVAASLGSRFADVLEWQQEVAAGSTHFNLVTVATPDDGGGNDRHLVVTTSMGPIPNPGAAHAALAWYVPLSLTRVSVREREFGSSWDLIPLAIERKSGPGATAKFNVDARYTVVGSSVYEGGVGETLALSGGFDAKLPTTRDAQLLALDGIWGLTAPLAIGDLTVRVLTVDNLRDPMPPSPFATNLGKTVITVRSTRANVAFDLKDRHMGLEAGSVKPAGARAITFTQLVNDLGPRGTLPGLAHHTETYRAEISDDLRSVKVTRTGRTPMVVDEGP